MKNKHYSHDRHWRVFALLGLLALPGQCFSTTLFADSFQGDLSQWAPGSSAAIVSDPLVPGGFALAFTQAKSGGDVFSRDQFTSGTQNTFQLSYDYLGLSTEKGAGGGYVGFNNPNETWLSGDGSHPTQFNNPDTGQWEHVSFSFVSSSPIQLKLEQWEGKSTAVKTALFKNLLLTDVSQETVNNTTYNPSNGNVYIQDVKVGQQHYQVNLQLSNGQFYVLNYQYAQQFFTVPVEFNVVTGALMLPEVNVAGKKYQVTLQHIGNFVFTLASFIPL